MNAVAPNREDSPLGSRTAQLVLDLVELAPEQVSGLTSRYARRTPAVTALLEAVALALGGRGLEPGQRVITGSFCNETVTGPGSWRAAFAGIGEVAVRFS